MARGGAAALAARVDDAMQLPDLSLLLVMVVFWATYFVLRATVFRPLGAILEEREHRVASATEALEQALSKEKETLADIDRRLTEARREAMVEREALRAEAATRRQARLEEAREEARGRADEAQARLEKEIAAAREQLSREARALATEIAGAALGRKVA